MLFDIIKRGRQDEQQFKVKGKFEIQPGKNYFVHDPIKQKDGRGHNNRVGISNEPQRINKKVIAAGNKQIRIKRFDRLQYDKKPQYYK